MLESELLEREIKKGHTVLVVGAHRSPVRDPSCLAVASIMHGGRGKLILLDDQSPKLEERVGIKINSRRQGEKRVSKPLLNMHDKLRAGDKLTDSTGDPYEYLTDMRLMRKHGSPIMLPRILFSDARRIDLPNESIDTIIDRGSTQHMLENTRADGKQGVENSREAFDEFLRVLRRPGKIIHFEYNGIPEWGSFTELIKNHFKNHAVREEDVEPGFRIGFIESIPPEIRRRLTESKGVVQGRFRFRKAVIITKT